MNKREYRLTHLERQSLRAVVLLALLSFLFNAPYLCAQTSSNGAARAELARQRRPFNTQNPNEDPATVGSFVDAAKSGRLDVVNLYVAAGINVNAPDKRGEIHSTALLNAIVSHQPKTALYLLARGADPNLANSDGVTPLSLATRAGIDSSNGRLREDYPELIDALIARGANIDARDGNGGTPLMEAALAGSVRASEILMNKGANINARTGSGESALLYTANPAVASFLLERGADPNVTDDEGRTPLMNVVKRGWLEVVRPALIEGYPELIRALLDKGANVNAQDKTGTTALMEAAANGDIDTVELLLAHGANLVLKNAGGETAFDIAVKNTRGAVVKAFIENGYPLTAKQRLKYYLARFAYGLALIFPALFLASIAALYFYSRRELKKPLGKTRGRITGRDNLPRLAPLKCDNCGGGIPLKLENMHCPYCGTPARTPDDYKETLTARAEAAAALQRAVAQWRRASFFTATPVRWFFWAIGFAWLAVTGVGAFNEFGRSLFSGHGFWFISALLGAVGLPFFSLSYASYLEDVRKRLPVIPEIGKNVGTAEVADCFSCGATIAYEAGQLVTSCGYCGGEIYRVALARRTREAATEEKERASLSLYTAMVEVAQRREELLVNLLFTPFYLPVLLYMAPVGAILILALLALLGSC